MKKPPRTQYFDALEVSPSWVGRYLVRPGGTTRPVFRWWNGKNWQLNRRKSTVPANFGSRPGDVWAGAAELVLEQKFVVRATRMQISQEKFFKHLQRSSTWVGLRI